MADDINIVISVDDKDVIRARKHQNKLQSAVAQLEREFRKGNITAAKHRSELNKQAAALGKLGGGYRKAMSEVNSYASTLKKATSAQVAQAQATAMAKNRTNKFGMVSQQVGYQVGDFFVQIQSGTSALVAFGQQGTQLAGLLPGVAGAVVGISLAVGTMLLRTRQQMNESESGMKGYKDAIKRVKEATEELDNENRRLAGGFVTIDEMLINARKNALQEEIKLLEQTLKLRESIDKLQEKGGVLKSIKGFFDENALGLRIIKGLVSSTVLSPDLQVSTAVQEEKLLSAYKKLNALNEVQSKNETANAKNTILQNSKLKHSYQDLANSKLKSIKDVDEKIAEESERLAKITFNRAMAFSRAYDDALYGAERKSRVKNYVDYLKLMSKEVKNNFDVISGQEYVNKPPKQQEYISNFDIVMAQELVQQEKLKKSRIKFARDMEILAQQLSLKGATQKMAKDLMPKEEMKRYNDLRDASIERQKMLNLELKYEEDSKELFDAKTEIQREQLVLSLKENNINWTLRRLLGEQFVEERKIEWAIRQQVDAVEEVKKAEGDLADKRKEFADLMGGYLESGFMSMIDGTKTVSQAFRSMAADIVKHLYKVLVVQTLIRNIGGMIPGSFGAALSSYGLTNANGNAFNNGNIIPYANGGVVGSPTMFNMSGGKTGLMGEAGPEAILPLKRGPNGKLGVESSGGSVIVNQTINVSTGVAQTVRNEIRTLMPQIAEGAKSAVLDAKRRGGSFGSAFA